MGGKGIAHGSPPGPRHTRRAARPASGGLDAKAAFDLGGLIEGRKRALAERAVSAERDPTARAAGLVAPFADAVKPPLAEVFRAVAPGAHAVLDGWHALVAPGNVSLVTLPPYSPELNAVERVWL